MHPRYQGQNPVVSKRVMKEQIDTWLVMLAVAGRESEIEDFARRAQGYTSRADVAALHKELEKLTKDLRSP